MSPLVETEHTGPLAGVAPVFGEIVQTFVKDRQFGYRRRGPSFIEPTALVALALVAYGQERPAREVLDGLVALQSTDGSLGICPEAATPRWPTSLVALAWQTAENAGAAGRYRRSLDRALDWLLAARGKTTERVDELDHDPTLVGWPWVEGTHSWLEPTCLAVLALKAAGQAQHPRTREAVRMIVDRLLPTGGCNYGNTRVLGNLLRPHLQPSGLALVALAGEDAGGKLGRCLEYVRNNVTPQTTPVSLAYALMGLEAQGTPHPHAADCLKTACRRAQREGSPLKLALLALAALGAANPLVRTAQPVE